MTDFCSLAGSLQILIYMSRYLMWGVLVLLLYKNGEVGKNNIDKN